MFLIDKYLVYKNAMKKCHFIQMRYSLAKINPPMFLSYNFEKILLN